MMMIGQYRFFNTIFVHSIKRRSLKIFIAGILRGALKNILNNVINDILPLVEGVISVFAATKVSRW